MVWNTTLLKMHVPVLFAFTIAGNMQNMKPVQCLHRFHLLHIPIIEWLYGGLEVPLSHGTIGFSGPAGR